MNCIEEATAGLLQQSYAIVPLPADLRRIFAQIPAAHAAIPAELKRTFSFPERLDGFLPFGAEHAQDNPDHPDLCERYCYFRKYRDAHGSHAMAMTTFYELIDAYERGIAALSVEVLDALFARLGAPAPQAPGAESYIQVCHYDAEHSAKGRERRYLMDPHHDGQLLTFIVQSEHGLMVGDEDHMEYLRFSPTQLFVMAGKLLELATDQEVKGVLHAVGRNPTNAARLSIMYFQNPSFEGSSYASLRTGSSIDFLAVANQIHQSYGLPAYK